MYDTKLSRKQLLIELERLRAREAKYTGQPDRQAVATLGELSARIVPESDDPAIYAEFLKAAVALIRADAGTIQLLDTATHQPQILAAQGLAQNGVGFSSEQTTPLTSRSGQPLGLISTCWREPYEPTRSELDYLGLLARQVADLIEQHQQQQALRESKERQVYLLKLSDALQPLSDPVEIQTTACRVLGEYTGASRVLYADVVGEKEVVIRNNYVIGVAPIVARLNAEEFGIEVVAAYKRNEKVIFSDVMADPRFSEAERRNFAAIGVAANASLGLLKDRRWVAAFGMHSTTPREWTPLEIELLEETAERTWAAVERAQAEAALRESQSMLQSFYDTAPLLIGIGEIDWDNYRVIAVSANRMTAEFFSRQPENIPGQFAPELGIPRSIETLWLEHLRKSQQEGLPVSFEFEYEDSRITDKVWLNATVVITGKGASGRPQYSFIVENITERKYREANLAFLAELDDEFSRLFTPEEILKATGDKLGVYLDVSQCGFSEFDVSTDRVNLFYSWSAHDMPDFTGTYRLSEFFEPARLEVMEQGETVVVNNVLTDPRLSPQTVAAVTAFNLFSFVEVPSLQQGKLKYELSVDASQPREWRADEIALIKEVTNRLFPRFERARSEKALLESEERFRLLTTATTYAVYTMSADWTEMYYLDGMNFVANTEKPSRTWVDEYIPAQDQFFVNEVIQEAIRTKTHFELEHRVILLDGSIGWTLSHAIPILNEQNEIKEWFGAASDVTARNRQEEALRESEEKYRIQLEIEVRERTGALNKSRDLLRATINSTKDMIQVFEAVRDGKGEIVDFNWILNNHAAEEVYGDVIGKSLLKNNPGVVEEGIFDIFKQVVETGISNQTEHHYVHEQFDGWFYQSAVKLNDGVATTTTNFTERKKAELEVLALKDEIARQATDKYRTLFDSIDEGFHISELIYDEAGKAVDWRYLEVNQVFERLTGLENVAGHLGSEVTPGTESYWLETYDKVVQTGEPLRFENYHEDTGRWYSAYTSRVGDTGSHQVGIIFDDITERKINEQHKEFLLKLSDTLRPLSDIAQIQSAACQLVAEHLQVDRCYYSEVNLAENWTRVEWEYTRGKIPSIVGTYPLAAFSWTIESFLKGEIFVLPDLATFRSLSQAEREAMAAIYAQAMVCVPLYQAGVWVACFALTQATPRQWKPHEIELVRETGERIWATIERARAEAALRESEAHFRAVTNLVPALLWQTDAAGKEVTWNPRWLEYTGQSLEQTQVGGWLDAIHPQDRPNSERVFTKAFRSGQELEVEHRIRRHDGEYRWFLVRQLPIKNEQGQVIQWFGAATDIHEQRLAREELEKRVMERTVELAVANAHLQKDRERLHQLSIRLLEVQETERRFLAKELHDEIGQYLTGLKFLLESSTRLPADEQAGKLAATLATVDELTTRVRELSLNLRPTLLDDMGLKPALVTHFQRYTAQSQIEVNFYHNGLEKRFQPEIETTVYRVVQEALTNVARHARTSKVLVQIIADGQLNLLIQDEGRGFDPEKVLSSHSSTGLSAMRERVELVGGSFILESEPDYGTTIVVEIPYKEF